MARLFRPIAVMTLAGLCLLVLLAIFLVQRFDSAASDRERHMVENGFHRQIEELDAVIVPQINWDEAVKALDHSYNPAWADLNLGDYLFTYNGFTRAFVIDGAGKLLYASVRGERREADAAAAYAPFAASVDAMLPRIRGAEADRPPIRPSGDEGSVVTRPIQANALVRVDDQLFLVITSLVQPDAGKVLPKGPRAPVAVMAMPIDAQMLRAFAGRYLVDDLRLVSHAGADPRLAYVDLHNLSGEQIATLAWSPRLPGLALVRELWPSAVLAILLLGFSVVIVMRSGAAIVSELITSEARAKHLAFHDPLTRLPNRAMLFERLRPLLAAIDTGGPSVVVTCVDLDRFKDVNDTLGHHAGDILIEAVANRLREACGDAALIARLGGDEFVVLFSGLDEPGARTMANAALASVMRPLECEYGTLEVGCSIGVAVIESAGVDPSEALRWADLALYRSKDAGRSRVTIFEPAMDAALRTRRSLEADLRLALADGALTMVYQPQVDREGAVVAVEALLRWIHPERGAIPPGVFVPLAEESGLILGLGEFVLRRVFAETRDWDCVRIAINVSPVQVRSPGFAAQVFRLVAQAGIDPSRYEIELTETALLGDDPVTQGNIDALKKMGFSIAIDDFGTGYSSLSLLQRFAIDKIKIDRSFVSAIGGSDESEALVDAMVKLARALNLNVIAEGVETEGQKNRLVQSGCREFQGHLVGMPMGAQLIGDVLGLPVQAKPEIKRLA